MNTKKLNWDCIIYCLNFIPEDYKIFRLISKNFFKNIVNDLKLCETDSLKLCKLYINFDRNLNEVRKYLIRAMENLLIFACELGKLEAVKYFVNIGVNVKTQNDFAVIRASQNGHLDVVKYLVSLGADSKASGDIPVVYASMNGHLDTVKYLVSQGADIKARDNLALIKASGNGHLGTVKYLVSLGADIQTNNSRIIIEASAYGQLHILWYLASIGVYVDVDCYDTAIYYAYENNHKEIVKYLKSLGARLNY